MLTKPFIYQLLLLLLIAINCSSRTLVKTSISGEIKGLTAGFLQLILEEDINRKKSKVVADIAIDKSGRFSFESDLMPHIYTLKLGNEKSVMLAVERGQRIFIKGDAASMDQLQITGSDDTRKLEAYEKFRKASLNRLVISVRNQIKELKQKGTEENDSRLLDLNMLEVENYAKHKDELIEFVKKEMGTSIAIYPTSIRWDGDKNVPSLVELAKQFQIAHPNTDIAERINEKVKAIASNSIGGKVSNIRMPDKDGREILLASLKARYILIDFWASWCAPCRRESLLLNELYQEFKPKGFEIYGVGLESSKEAWMKAIEKDRRTWINVTSLQEFETPAAFDYAVTSLPANVLIDSTGKVIARNLHGNDLKEVIEKLFSSKN